MSIFDFDSLVSVWRESTKMSVNGQNIKVSNAWTSSDLSNPDSHGSQLLVLISKSSGTNINNLTNENGEQYFYIGISSVGGLDVIK